ncbi:MAG: hypothetical protein K0Q68_310 [Moraxellaceae bacterium]|jgi:hypothetical protein|nr:hypothetical protein [Moraxellaceae bacterium]
MPPPSTPLLDLTPEQVRQRRRAVQLRQLLIRRLPLMAWESLLQRLDGLRRQHPQQAGFVQEMTCRASRLRLEQDMEIARELEDDYLRHLAAEGITETWHDARADEAELLDRHYHLLRSALQTPLAPEAVARFERRCDHPGEPS